MPGAQDAISAALDESAVSVQKCPRNSAHSVEWFLVKAAAFKNSALRCLRQSSAAAGLLCGDDGDGTLSSMHGLRATEF